MFKNLSATGLRLLLTLLVLTSCGRGKDYDPVQASLSSCRILVECLGNDGRNLLTDKTFVASISIEGETSHSTLRHEIVAIGDRRYIAFNADIPGTDDLQWNVSHKEATAITRVNVNFGKQKIELRCMMKYTAQRPPAIAGGVLTLEEVTYNNRTISRSGSTVTITLRMDRNGRLV